MLMILLTVLAVVVFYLYDEVKELKESLKDTDKFYGREMTRLNNEIEQMERDSRYAHKEIRKLKELNGVDDD